MIIFGSGLVYLWYRTNSYKNPVLPQRNIQKNQLSSPERIIEPNLSVRTDNRKTGQMWVLVLGKWSQSSFPYPGQVGYTNHQFERWDVMGVITDITGETVSLDLDKSSSCQDDLNESKVSVGSGRLCGTARFTLAGPVKFRPATWDLNLVPEGIDGTLTDLKVGDIVTGLSTKEIISQKEGIIDSVWGWQ